MGADHDLLSLASVTGRTGLGFTESSSPSGSSHLVQDLESRIAFARFDVADGMHSNAGEFGKVDLVDPEMATAISNEFAKFGSNIHLSE